MVSLRLFLFILIAIIFFFSPVKIFGDKMQGKIEEATYSTATDYENQLEKQYVFYFLRLKSDENFFSFNIPQEVFEELTPAQKDELIQTLLGLYEEAFRKFKTIFGYIPKGYKFNITFGKTSMGTAFNKVYSASKISNIFPNFLPYIKEDNVVIKEDKVMLHEIGHSLFAIAVGTLEHPKTKAFEEGFVDYIAGREKNSQKFLVSQENLKKMNGLTQLDIDSSIWGKPAVLKEVGMKGYAGFTHHVFGVEFINVFISIFGQRHLAEFLIRLKSIDKELVGPDFGTSEIRVIFKKMGFTNDEVLKFENMLHVKLKENVFMIE